jgi:hypothetical protein
MPGRHPEMHGGVEPGGVRQPTLTEQPLFRPQGAYLYLLLPVLRIVFRIHDILVWIRIRGSMPITNGSGSCYFRHRPSRCQQKTNFLTQFFLLITF